MTHNPQIQPHSAHRRLSRSEAEVAEQRGADRSWRVTSALPPPDVLLGRLESSRGTPFLYRTILLWSLSLAEGTLLSMGDPNSDLTFLRGVILAFLDIGGFYCSQDPRAVEARQLVNAQHGRVKAFHSQAWSEFRLLLEALVSLAPAADQQESAAEKIHDLLHVLEDDFTRGADLQASKSVSRVVPIIPRGPGLTGLQVTQDTLWPQLQNLTASIAVVAVDQRLEWLIQRTRLRKPKRSAQKRIIKTTRKCRQALEPNKHSILTSTERERARKSRRHDATLRFDVVCMQMEQMHKGLWSCRCEPSHADTKFCFDPNSRMDSMSMESSLCCLLVYPSSQSLHGWKRAELLSDTDLNSGITRHEQTSLWDNFCVELERDVLLPVPTGNTQPTLSSTRQICIRGDCGPPIKLEDAIALRNSSLKERLVIALYLSHMYLHLSGGPWWEYQQTQNIVWFEQSSTFAHPQLTLPYFSAPPAQPCVAPMLYRMIHSDMPSLPVFGKTLLELFTGRKINWAPGQIDEAIESYGKEPFAREILDIINTLLCFNNATIMKSGTMRETERMRMHFEHAVIDTLHYILEIGFHVEFNDEVKRAWSGSEPVQTNLLQMQGEDGDRIPPKEMEASAAAGMCLHDDGGKDRLDQDESVISSVISHVPIYLTRRTARAVPTNGSKGCTRVSRVAKLPSFRI